MEEKRLLYFDKLTQQNFSLNESVRMKIGYLVCKDVKTSETITLGLCAYPEVASKTLDVAELYYDNINKITNDYDLLWILTEETVSNIPYTFEYVQNEYQRLVNEGVKNEEINSAMVTLFQNKTKKK